MMRYSLIIALLVLSPPLWAIKKCQDADGNWHYGDIAAAACEQSKITTLTERGFIESEQAAPKTKQQLAAEAELQKQQQEETARKQAIEDERMRIRNIYETEDDIDRLRDMQLNSVLSNISVHEAYLKAMDRRIAHYEQKQSEAPTPRQKEHYAKQISSAQERIAIYEKELVLLRQQKEQIMQKFEREREIYRSLKSTSS